MLHVNCIYCIAITDEFLHSEYKVALHFIVLADQHKVKLQSLQSTSRYQIYPDKTATADRLGVNY